jgi:hypothetical protein
VSGKAEWIFFPNLHRKPILKTITYEKEYHFISLCSFADRYLSLRPENKHSHFTGEKRWMGAYVQRKGF